ncbi:hypothetical protein SAMN05216270_12334 [Glycomyces harbinensis]|uniref:Uncharacterized protein n=1 Tax=Glycomyces harbinensis TaxID=58114 RepID=A0A1G7D6A8_9ACTN|nr:hypothetical protein SAMN05216270_12334 [Glycomyces harbinensis]
MGIWFALVGMSAGTVASFALVGWTFTRGLYGGVETAQPYEFESGTVVIEEEPSAEANAGEGAEEPGPGGIAEPGSASEVDPSPADPQAEPRPDADQEHPDEESGEPEAPAEQDEVQDPELVPVEESSECGNEESQAPADPDDDPDHGHDWDHEWDGDWDRDDPWLRPESDAIELPLLD